MQFLQLPREIRDLIYKSALCSSRGCKVINKYNRPAREGGFRSDGLKLALLRVCRQVHTEALPIFLGHNVFYIDDSDNLRELVTERNRLYVRFISLLPTGQTPFHRAQFDSAFSKLAQLEYLELQSKTSSGIQTQRVTAQNPEDAVRPLAVTSRTIKAADVARIFKANQSRITHESSGYL